MSKSLSKTQKKTDNAIRKTLLELCENELKKIDGFQWLTHQANFANFPASLLVSCIFDNSDNQQKAQQKDDIYHLIQRALLKIGVRFKSIKQQIIFDNQESCEQENSGNWKERLGKYKHRAIPKNHPH